MYIPISAYDKMNYFLTHTRWDSVPEELTTAALTALKACHEAYLVDYRPSQMYEKNETAMSKA